MGMKARQTARDREHLTVLLARIRSELVGRGPVSEQKMFGGVAFLVRGNMSFGVTKNGDLMVRVGADAYQQALAQLHARPMDFTGRPLRGFVYVSSAGITTDAALSRWMSMGLDYAGSLPQKR